MESPFFGSEFEDAWRGWKAKQNNKGVIYYVNETKQITSWNHPYFSKVTEDSNIRHGEIKYAAYRTALKLRELQSKIGLNWIQLAAVKQVFASCHSENVNSQLCYSEALALIEEILHVSDRQQQHEGHVSVAADLILNLMTNLYDVNRSGAILKRSVRNALTTMCSAKLNEKYRYFFTLVKDESHVVCKRKLYLLLNDLLQFTYVVKEGESFGDCVAATVDSCFRMAGGSNNEKVSYEGFYSWLMLEPQTLVWLPTFHRILATETVQHSVCCKVCDTAPVTGLRYRCLQCLKYNLCQGCFLHGHTSLSHKLRHAVIEYCLPTSVKDDTKALVKIMKNKISKRHRGQQAKPVYLPVDASAEHSALQDWQSVNIQSNSSNSTDSGLAVGSDCDDAANNGQDGQLGTGGQEFKKQNRSVDVLGEPCSTSSPLIATLQNFVRLSVRDKENLQKNLLLKIEQLQRENRILQKRLHSTHMYFGTELADKTSDGEECVAGTSSDQWNDEPQREISTNSPISPIMTEVATVCADVSLSENRQSEARDGSASSSERRPSVLDIIGVFSPVGSAQLCTPPQFPLFGNIENVKELQDCSRQIDLSESFGLCDQSGDVGVSCSRMKDDSCQEKHENKFDDTGMTDSALSVGLAYRSSDMSVNCQGTYKESVVQDSGLLKIKNSLIENEQPGKPSGDLRPANGSEECLSIPGKTRATSPLHSWKPFKRSSQKSLPCLVFSSDSTRNKLGTINSSDENVSSDQQNKSVQNYSEASEDHSSIELSEIFQHSQMLHSRGPSLSPVLIHTATRRKVMDPVHMSTPVAECRSHFITPHLSVTEHAKTRHSSKVSHLSPDKENWRPALNKNLSRSGYSADLTPLSTTPWYRKRILMSLNSVLSDHSKSYTENAGDIRDLSALFRKAELIGNKISEGTSKTMMTLERNELEELMTDLQEECRSGDALYSVEHDLARTDNERILEAALNIGCAMATLVQATALHPEVQ